MALRDRFCPSDYLYIVGENITESYFYYLKIPRDEKKENHNVELIRQALNSEPESGTFAETVMGSFELTKFIKWITRESPILQENDKNYKYCYEYYRNIKDICVSLADENDKNPYQYRYTYIKQGKVVGYKDEVMFFGSRDIIFSAEKIRKHFSDSQKNF